MVEWAPVVNVAETCAKHHGIAMPGGCMVVWNEASVSLVTSAQETDTKQLGAMLRYALSGRR